MGTIKEFRKTEEERMLIKNYLKGLEERKERLNRLSGVINYRTQLIVFNRRTISTVRTNKF